MLLRRVDHVRTATYAWAKRQDSLTDPDRDRGLIGKIRGHLTNTEQRIRPELLAQAVNRHAAANAVFTTDTGMSTVWLSRFVQMTDERALLGSFWDQWRRDAPGPGRAGLGPHAPGHRLLRRRRYRCCSAI